MNRYPKSTLKKLVDLYLWLLHFYAFIYNLSSNYIWNILSSYMCIKSYIYEEDEFIETRMLLQQYVPFLFLLV
jgi:hypothetical protein